MTTARALRIVAVAAVAWVVCSAPPAAAVTPPTVDATRLPPARPPGPPTATEQTTACPVAVRSAGAAGGQLDAEELRAVWQLTRGSGQTVAVIDTGVARHRRLPHLLPGGDYVSTGDGTQDCDGHGTIVAGIIGAAPEGEPGTGFSGIAPDVGIIAIRQSSNEFRFTGPSAGAGVGDVDTLAAAVRAAADAGATVVNISSVACVPAAQGIDDRSLGAALAYAVDVKNVVVVAAAGNVGGAGQCPRQNPVRPGRPDWDAVEVVVSPAWYDDYVLTVGSVDRAGRPSAFTLGGPWVDVAARGEGVVSLNPDGEGLIDTVAGAPEPAPLAGTSYSAPVVTGIAALVRAAAPHLTARQVMRRIVDTAHHPAAGWDPRVGYGTVDALAAVSADPTAMATPAAPPSAVRGEPDHAGPDPASRTVSMFGAAACVVLTTIVMTLSANGLRRRGQTVPED